jgi:hypothetical protein
MKRHRGAGGARRNDFARFKQRVKAKAKLHPPMGSDYFLFPALATKLSPPSPSGAPVGITGSSSTAASRVGRWVDATHDVTIVHQSHDYRHLPGGQRITACEKDENVESGRRLPHSSSPSPMRSMTGRWKACEKPLTLKKIAARVEIAPLTRLHSHSLGKLFFYCITRAKVTRHCGVG